jgi:cell division protein FtsL
MLRFLNIVAVLLAGAFAFFLYSMKYETQSLEKRKAGLERQKEDLHRSIAVLRAEWSHLTRPERVERLARLHLGMKPLEVHQIAQLETLRLPERLAGRSGEEDVPLLFTASRRNFPVGERRER